MTAVRLLICWHRKCFTAEETYLDVELAGSMTAGCTVVDLKGYLHQDANATVCLDINQDAFRQWFVDSITEVYLIKRGGN